MAMTVELLVGKDCISAYHLSVEVLLPINIPCSVVCNRPTL